MHAGRFLERWRAGPPRQRPLTGWIIGTVGVLVVTAVLVPTIGQDSAAIPALCLVAPVMVAALIGGWLAAVGVAAEAGMAYAAGFLPPVGSARVDAGHDLLALVVFVTVAVGQGVFVGALVQAERRRVVADRSRLGALETIDRQRRGLLASVSHDLRTPLTAIRAVTSELAGGARYDEATLRRLCAVVDQEAARLDRIIGNVLVLSQAEAGELTANRVTSDLVEIVEACTARQRRLAPEGVTIAAPGLPELCLVEADPVQVDQIITNLLENAVRFAPAGSEVRVGVRADGGRAEVTVSDQGPGVPAALRPAVFEPFRAGPNAGRSGLGLAVARAFAEANGGSLRLHDGDGVGARFSFDLARSG